MELKKELAKRFLQIKINQRNNIQGTSVQTITFLKKLPKK